MVDINETQVYKWEITFYCKYIFLPSLWVQYSDINSLLWDVGLNSITSIVVFTSRNTQIMSTNDYYSLRLVVCIYDRWYWGTVPWSYSTSSSFLFLEFFLRSFFIFLSIFCSPTSVQNLPFFKIFHDHLSFLSSWLATATSFYNNYFMIFTS